MHNHVLEGGMRTDRLACAGFVTEIHGKGSPGTHKLQLEEDEATQGTLL